MRTTHHKLSAIITAAPRTRAGTQVFWNYGCSVKFLVSKHDKKFFIACRNLCQVGIKRGKPSRKITGRKFRINPLVAELKAVKRRGEWVVHKAFFRTG